MTTDRKQTLQAEITELENRLIAKRSELEQLYKQIEHRALQPVSDETIRNHLAGEIPPGNSGGYAIPFVMGIYPLLVDETCWFLALDFDKD